jgi:hypothetical protein
VRKTAPWAGRLILVPRRLRNDLRGRIHRVGRCGPLSRQGTGKKSWRQFCRRHCRQKFGAITLLRCRRRSLH